MSEYIAVAQVADIPDPGRLVAEVDERIIVLLHVAGEVFAIDDVCTHDGGPLSEGELTDHAIACPRHGARFDIRTGRALSMPATQPTVVHDVKIEAGQIFVRLRER